MKKLTRKQKLEAYTYVLLIVYYGQSLRGSVFVCIELKEWINRALNKHYERSREIHKYFPEFMRQCPEHTYPDEQWWPDYAFEPRIQAIERAIQLTEQLPN